MGWDALGNGELIDAAEQGGFDVMVTADQNLQYQQNLTSRRLALVVLESNQWPVVRASADRVLQAVNAAAPGSYQAIHFRSPFPSPPPVHSVGGALISAMGLVEPHGVTDDLGRQPMAAVGIRW
jgi:hypothetical protein